MSTFLSHFSLFKRNTFLLFIYCLNYFFSGLFWSIVNACWLSRLFQSAAIWLISELKIYLIELLPASYHYHLAWVNHRSLPRWFITASTNESRPRPALANQEPSLSVQKSNSIIGRNLCGCCCCCSWSSFRILVFFFIHAQIEKKYSNECVRQWPSTLAFSPLHLLTMVLY